MNSWALLSIQHFRWPLYPKWQLRLWPLQSFTPQWLHILLRGHWHCCCSSVFSDYPICCSFTKMSPRCRAVDNFVICLKNPEYPQNPKHLNCFLWCTFSTTGVSIASLHFLLHFIILLPVLICIFWNICLFLILLQKNFYWKTFRSIFPMEKALWLTRTRRNNEPPEMSDYLLFRETSCQLVRICSRKTFKIGNGSSVKSTE